MEWLQARKTRPSLDVETLEDRRLLSWFGPVASNEFSAAHLPTPDAQPAPLVASTSPTSSSSSSNSALQNFTFGQTHQFSHSDSNSRVDSTGQTESASSTSSSASFVGPTMNGSSEWHHNDLANSSQVGSSSATDPGAFSTAWSDHWQGRSESGWGRWASSSSTDSSAASSTADSPSSSSSSSADSPSDSASAPPPPPLPRPMPAGSSTVSAMSTGSSNSNPGSAQNYAANQVGSGPGTFSARESDSSPGSGSVMTSAATTATPSPAFASRSSTEQTALVATFTAPSAASAFAPSGSLGVTAHPSNDFQATSRFDSAIPSMVSLGNAVAASASRGGSTEVPTTGLTGPVSGLVAVASGMDIYRINLAPTNPGLGVSPAPSGGLSGSQAPATSGSNSETSRRPGLVTEGPESGNWELDESRTVSSEEESDQVGSLPMPEPALAGLMRAMSPLDRDALEQAIERIFEPLDGLTSSIPELRGPVGLLLASLSAAATVVGVEVAIRLRRRRDEEGASGDDVRNLSTFPGI